MIIFNIGRRVRLSEFYKKANILKVEDLIKISDLKISYRYVNGTLPKRISNLFEISVHDYITRNRNNSTIKVSWEVHLICGFVYLE